MSSSSTQQTVEKTEAVKDVKGMKPLVKPKPIVPPKPKQASLSTSSEIKSPLLSPNSGGPCSPTFDIPSAFKISQLTGPQPYGARRTSLKRWSSSVGEDVPLENNTLLSPVQNAVPESISKITTKPITSPVKPLQTGSVWKGKSPFMLTTRGWGEQKSQEKDNHESESFSQKHSFSSVSKDADLKDKDTILEEDTVRDLRSPTRSMSAVDHGGVDTNIQDPKQSLSRTSEEVEKTSFGLTSPEKLEMPVQDNEIKRFKESSSRLSVSPQTDLHLETTKQFKEHEHNKRYTETESCNYKSDRETAECTEDIYGAATEVINTSLRTKDHEEPHVISPVPAARKKAKKLVTENTENAEIVEESPLSETPKPTAQEVYMYHQDRSNDIPELRTVIREDQDTDSVYIQTSQNQIRIENQNTEQGILGKLEQVEKHDVSSGTQIANKLVTENEIYTTIPHEDKESTDCMEHNLLYSPEHYDLHGGKTQVSSDDNNKPYSDQEDKMVAPTHIQSPVCTVRSCEIYSEGQQKTSSKIHDKNIEEEQELFKIAQYGNDATIQAGKYVSHQTSDVFEKQTEYPSEYRSAFGNNAIFSQDSETPSAPELHEPAHNEPSADLYVGSPMLENYSMITEDVYSHPVDESKELFHSYVEKDTQTGKPKEELSHLESYEASRPEMNYDESHFRYSKTTSQDPAARVTQPEELSDHYKQSARLEYYTAQSPILNECEVPLNKLEDKADDSCKPHYTHSQSQEECNYSHTVETEDKQSDEPVHKYGQSVDEDYRYQQLDNAVYKYNQSDKPRNIYEQLEESVPRSELSKEPTYTYEQAEEPVSRYQRSEGSDLIYQQTEESDHRHQKLEDSVHKYELLEEPSYKCGESEETVHRDDQSEESDHGYKKSDKPASTDEQSEQLVQSYQQPKTIVHTYQQSEEPVHVYEQSEEAVQKYGHLEEPSNTYEQPEESEHRYAYLEETVYIEQLEDPFHKYKQLDEATDKHEQREHPVQGYQTLEEPIHKYETFEEPVNIYKLSEEIIHSNDQSQEPDQKYNQHDEPGHSYEPEKQYGQVEDPAYIHTGSDVKNAEYIQSRLNNLEPLQQEFTPVQSEEMDSTPHISTASHDIHVTCPEKDIRPSEYLEQHLNESYMVEPKYSDADEMYKEKTTQVHNYHQSEEQQLPSAHKEEREQSPTKSEEAQHVDGLSEGSKQESPVTTTIESDESTPEETQDHPAEITYQILNGHAEHEELQTVDSTSDAVKEIQADPDAEDIQAEEPSSENFDFLEGTVVLDSSFMRGRASLGKKRGHRTPAGTGAPEDQDPEYWMFRDSTDPKSISERQTNENEKAEASPDRTPDNSPSPVKSPNKKGIFAGIISPSLLKGRLKSRSKTTEDETVRPEVEESKSPGKEKPESSGHSLNWLHGLRKKRKSSKESSKEEKKKQSK